MQVSSIGILGAFQEFRGCVKGILKKFIDVKLKFSWCFKKVSRVLLKVFSVFQGRLKSLSSVSREFKSNFKEVGRMKQRYFKDVSMVF